MPTGQKHLVKCRCVLPQYKRARDAPSHRFIVFSIIGDDNKVIPKFAQCNNCGIIHKITELGVSELVGREAMTSLMTIDDIKTSMPEGLVAILSAADVDLPTWELARFIYDNKRWGEFVALTSEVESGVRAGKYVRILGERLFKVDAFTREEGVI